ncbi:MAG: hypothetical protein QGM50_12425 [Anaerolineae bacterium]|nr:hypothetical protein [Bacteroidota bacterium]MDK1082207.1 hypothetical protein [Anaerolineae bacterium]MDK1119576.1 hypothetical protein [Anaerolineae bacterium]
MSLPELESKQYPLEILTEHFLMQGVVEPIGQLMNYLDAPDHVKLYVKNLTMSSLGRNSTVDALKVKGLWVHKNEIIAIRLNESDLENTVQKLPIEERVRLFLPRFVVQGTLTHGEDTKLGDMFEVMKGTWAALTNVKIYPLANLKIQVFSEAPFLLINKNLIRFYDAVSE